MKRYFVDSVNSYNRSTVMEGNLINFARRKLGFVMTERRVKEWVQEIRDEQRKLLEANQRIKPAEIRMDRYGMADEHILICIGENSVRLEPVNGEEE